MVATGMGLAALRKMQEATGSNRYGDRKLRLWLKDGERARFWFLQDETHLPVMLVHPETRLNKKTGSTFWVDTACGRVDLDESPDLCSKCVDQVSKGPFPRALAPVYVVSILHPTQDDEKTWTPVKITLPDGSIKIKYLQLVEDVWIFPMKDKEAGQLEGLLEEDPTDADVPVIKLLDQSFVLECKGQGQAKTVILKADPKKPIPAAVVEARASMTPAVVEAIIRSELGDRPKKALVVNAATASSTVQYGDEMGGTDSANQIIEYTADDEARSMPNVDF